ncbi:PspA/IM30 family protein [Bacillus sp. sid0103]|uniref:PspA/IM30 family protein n=1 Tax=Bacillus sp. sid0103 TaxID=2856337 RepID=UPI001C48A8DF|nr:PspA/IM30 family protein [Bacillus sp. sid0103]MBV7508458.1 PspA/IM30 family protein [Bacillus sp. sid0103]
MANLLTKIKDLIIADLNESMQHKGQQNPIALLNQYLRECEQETEKVGRLVERQASLKAEFTREYFQATERSEKRKHQAEIALKAGETELYQFAAAEHQQYADRAERLNISLANVTDQLIELERKHEEMKQRLKDMHLRRMELMGRENVTRANLKINQVSESNSLSEQFSSKFKDIENYLERLEQRVNHSFIHSTFDARVEQLEKEMAKQDDPSVKLTKE